MRRKCRSPQGERGLKCIALGTHHHLVESLSARRAWIEIMTSILAHIGPKMSLSARRAWIEIVMFPLPPADGGRRSPQGERGLKYIPRKREKTRLGRSPQGERGLKFSRIAPKSAVQQSLSARRAWIEIWQNPARRCTARGRSPQGERGLKLSGNEIKIQHEVALRKESVD